MAAALKMDTDFILKSRFPEIPQPKETSVADYILNRIKESQTVHGTAGLIINASAGEGELGQCIKYSEFDRLSSNVAKTLTSPPLNFQAGDFLVYSAIHPTQAFVFLLGIWRANGIPFASYAADIEGGGLLRRIRQSKAKFLLVDEHHAAQALELVKELPWKVIVMSFGQSLPVGCISASDMIFNDTADAHTPSAVPPVHENGSAVDAPALILPTSGTTGESKGALLSHKFLMNGIEIGATFPYQETWSDFVLLSAAASAPTHTYGLRIGFARITVGQNIIGVVDSCPSTILSAVHRFRPYTILAFPKELQQLVKMSRDKNAFESVRVVELAGSVIPPVYIQRLKENLPNLHSAIIMYGMTELSTVAVTLEWTLEAGRSMAKYLPGAPVNSSGLLSPGVALKVKSIDSEDGAGPNLGPGAVGEFWVQSNRMMSGYFDNPTATEMTIVDGWLRTGDLGYYDEQGFVINCGRTKDIIVSHGNHVCPQEIEQVLLSHGRVREACVVGVQDLDDDMIRAFVVLQEQLVNFGTNETLEEVASEIERFVNDRLPEYKHIRAGVVFLPKLVYGKSGKVDSKALKALFSCTKITKQPAKEMMPNTKE